MILLSLFIFTLLSIIRFTWKNGISPMPSSQRARRAIARVWKGDEPDVIYELGSGWGHLACDLARSFPTAQIIAVENSWIPYLVSRLWLWPYRNITVRYGNFMEMDLSEVRWAVTYQFQGGVEPIYRKLTVDTKGESKRDPKGDVKQDGRGEVKGRVELLSYVFGIDGVKPASTIEGGDLYGSVIYRYTLD